MIVVLESVEALGLDPIYQTFDKLGLPKEPPLSDEIPPLDIVGIVGKAQRILGLNLFLNFFVNEDIRNTSRNRITVSLYRRQYFPRDIISFVRLNAPSRFESPPIEPNRGTIAGGADVTGSWRTLSPRFPTISIGISGIPDVYQRNGRTRWRRE